jgi:glycosyltransferase involved in cell wall biosynthesis
MSLSIVVVTPLFALAGVPLAQIRFAKALARRGHQVKLIVGYVDPNFQFPEIHDIEIEVWNKPQVSSMLWPLITHLRSNNPDIVFSAEDHLNTIICLAAILSGSKAKISGSSRVTPFDTYSNTAFTKRWILKQLSKSVMGRANVLTCVSMDMVSQYRTVFKNPPHVCVYNIVDDQDSRKRMTEELQLPWVDESSIPLIVAAGRLAPWKGFADLIEAINIMKRKRQVRLIILGDGPLRGELQTLIDTYELQQYVKLYGYVSNPLKFFAKSKVFVLSSLVEGLPNVLVEAMMCGCTPVSTDCPTGPREVLHDGKYGYLVPVNDPEAMAIAIEKALDHPIPKQLLDEAILPFEENRIIDRHFELLGVQG